MSCVNKSSKEFKKLAQDNNVSENTLELIIHKYWLETGSEEYFPTDVYIQAQLGNGQYKESISAVRKLWERDYQHPQTFGSLEEAKRAYDKALTFFPVEAVHYYKDAQNKYILTVKQPVTNPVTTAKTFFEADGNVRKLDLGLQEGVPQSVDKVQELYNKFNTDRTTKYLADKVFSVAKKVNLQIIFNEKLPDTTVGRSSNDNTVTFRKSFFERDAEASKKAPIILHDMIHAVTTYALSDQTTDWHKTAPVEKFRREAYDIFEKVRYNKALEGERGTHDVFEFVAELSNPIFRQKLQSIDNRKWYTKILDAFKTIFGIHSSSTYYNRMMNALDGALEAFDMNSYMEYNGMKSQLRQAYNDHKVDFEEMSESDLKTVFKNAVAESEFSSTEKTPVIDQLKPQYRGKLIYAQSGTGKSFIADNVTVFDSDFLLGEVLGVSPETAGFFFHQMSTDQKKAFGQQYRDLIRQKIAEGKTVLTANEKLMDEADVVVYNQSAEQTEKRANSSDRAITNQYSALDYHRNTLEHIQNLKRDEKNKEYIELGEKSYLADHLLSDMVPNSSSSVTTDNTGIYSNVHHSDEPNTGSNVRRQRLGRQGGVDKTSGLTQQKLINDFLNTFGITVNHLDDYDSNVPLFDALNRVINARSAEDITNGMGYAIAFMMQADPEMERIMHLAHGGWVKNDKEYVIPRWLARITPEKGILSDPGKLPIIGQKQFEVFGVKFSPKEFTGYRVANLTGEQAKRRYPWRNKVFKAVGEQIAQELKKHFKEDYNNVKTNKDNNVIWHFIKKFFSSLGRIVPVYRFVRKGKKEQKAFVADIVDALSRGDFSRIQGPLVKPDTTEKAERVEVEKALKENPFEADIIKKLNKHGISLAGSASIALEGTLFRPIENPLHDIDFSAGDNSSKATLDELLPKVFGKDRVHFASLILDDKREGNDTVTYVVLDRDFTVKSTGRNKAEYYDLQGNYLGKRVDYSELELEPGVKGKMLDFFVGPNKGSEHGNFTTTINGDEYLISNSNGAMAAKILWARPKDMWDYKHLIKNDFNPEANGLASFIEFMSKDQLLSQLRQIKQEYHDYDLVSNKQNEPAKSSTFTFNDGTAVNVPFTPNDQQAEALNVMNDFIHSRETSMTLSGYAGTGKTSLMEIIAQKARRDGKPIVFCATTNKAASVLDSKVSKQGFSASTLNKVFGIGVEVDSNKAYDAKNLVNTLHDNEITHGSTVIIDEASMINEANYKIINQIAEDNNLKIIYVGDRAQLAPVGEKEVSIVFRNSDGKVIELTKVERTDDNAVLKEATRIRNGEGMSYESSFNKEGKGVAFLNPDGERRQEIVDTINHFIPGLKKDPNHFRILSYTNESVEKYNNYVRKKLGYDNTPQKGEPIMGYANWGYNWKTKTYRFINSGAYTVINTRAPEKKVLRPGGKELVINITPLYLKDSNGHIEIFDFIDIKNDPANRQAVILLATMKKQLWDRAINASKVRKRDLLQQINAIDRFLFVNDNIVDNEGHFLQTKTFDFGYAHTIHKSQGSTFTNVLLDAKNIAMAPGKPQAVVSADAVSPVSEQEAAYNISNDPSKATMIGTPDEGDLGLGEGTSVSTPTATTDNAVADIRQQLEYVGMSRATDTVTVITNDAKKEDSVLNHLKEKGADKPVKETPSPAAPQKKEVPDPITTAVEKWRNDPEHRVNLAGYEHFNDLYEDTVVDAEWKVPMLLELDHQLSTTNNQNTAILDKMEAILKAPSKEALERTSQQTSVQSYTGDITPDANTVFVFGSNPEGRHGAGAAKVAREKFGAIYGQGEGLQGNAYALPTKDLKVKENNSLRSISEDKIVDSIKKLYETARQNPDKQFKVAYRNTDKASLNGYTGLEMIDMFLKAGEIPSNMVFSKEWVDTGKFDNVAPIEASITQTIAPSKVTMHSGGANGSDTYWGDVGARKYGIKVNHYYGEGNNTPKGNVPVSREELTEADEHLKKANKTLKRTFPTSSEYVNNLLRRDWSQAKHADAVFAISSFDKGQVKGGTAWAVQMAIDNNKPVYVFDQNQNKWFTYKDKSWVETETPILTPEFAGIGTRQLKENGKKAIEEVYKKTFESIINTTESTLNNSNLNQDNNGQQGTDSRGVVQSTVPGNIQIQWGQEVRRRGSSSSQEAQAGRRTDTTGVRRHGDDVAKQVSEASDALDKKLADKGIKATKQKVRKAESQEFHDAIAEAKMQNPNGWMVDVHEVFDYDNDLCMLTEDGKAGIAVTKDGDIISVFSAVSRDHRLEKLMQMAIAAGGKKLDCYYLNVNGVQTGLPLLYAHFGFKVESTTPFDAQYAPEEFSVWQGNNPNKTVEGVAAMSLKVEDAIESYSLDNTSDLENAPSFSDYDEMLEWRDEHKIHLPNYEYFRSIDNGTTVDFAWKIPKLKELEAELNVDNDMNQNEETLNMIDEVLKAATEDDIPSGTSAKKKAEIQKDLEDYDKINQQINNLREGRFDKNAEGYVEGIETLKDLDISFSSSEIRKVAEFIGNHITDLITKLQTDKNALAELFPALKFKEEDSDFTTKSRREIVEALGMQALIDRAKFDFNPENEVFDYDDMEIMVKANIAGQNWDALVLMASNIFHSNEGFGIARNYKDNKFELNTDEGNQIAFDDFNGFRDEDSINETEGDSQEHWQVEVKTIDVLNSMSELVRMGLHECYILDEKGNRVVDEGWKQPLRVNPREATNSILRWTQGALTIEDMINKLQGKQPSNPWLSQLITRLSDKTGNESDFQSQFFGIFMKPFQLYSITQLDGGKYTAMPVNSHPALSEATNSITAQFRLGEHPLFNADGRINSKLLGNKNTTAESHEFNLNQALTALQTIKERLQKGHEELSTEISQEAAKWLTGVYRVLGYNVTEDMVTNILNQENVVYLTNKLGYLVKDLGDELELQRNNTNRKYDPFKFKGENNIGGTLTNFLKPITESLEDVAISAFYDSGNMYQSYTTPSFMTKLVEKFKSLEGEKFEEFIRKEYAGSEWYRDQKRWDIRSGWRNRLIGKLVRDPKAREVFSFKVELNFNKHNYMRNMTDSEYTLSIITNYFAEGWKNKEANVSWFRMPMQSNKPSSEFYRFYAYRGEGDYKSAIISDLYDMFLQELSRIQTVNMRNKVKGEDAFMQTFDTEGKEFNYLPFLNPYLEKGNKAERTLLRNEDNTVSADNETLASLLKRKLEGSEKTKLSAEEEANLMTLVSKAIRNHMEKRTFEILNNWEKNGIVEAARNIKNIVEHEDLLKKDAKEDDPTRNEYVKESLENFIWNDYLASKNILQLTIGDIAFYKDAEDLQKRLAQLHAPGIRANVLARDYGDGKHEARRVSDGIYRTVILKDWDNFISNIIDNISEVFDRKIAAAPENQKAQMIALKESLVGENGSYRRINVADAQGFSSPSSYRKKALMFGKWSRDAEALYQDLKNNYAKIIKGEYTYTDLKNAFQPLKPFVYSHLQKDLGVADAPIHKMPVPFQAKNSEYLLIMADAIIRGDEAAGNKLSRPNLLRALYRVMEESEQLNPTKGIDTVQFESAIKSGGQGAINIHQFAEMPGGEEAAYTYMMDKIYKSADGKRISEYNTDVFVHEAPYEDYCLQQEVPAHFQNHSQAHGSQTRMIIPSDLDFYIDANGDHSDPNNINYYEWTEPDGTKKRLNAKEFKREYEENIAESIEEDINALWQELHLGATTKQERNIALSKILQREILSSPRYGIDLLQACSVDKATGEFRIPKGDPIQAKRIEQLINSIIKNRINKQKIAGGPIVQVSNYGTSKQLRIRFYDKQGGILKTREEYEKDPIKKTSQVDKFNAKYKGVTSQSTMSYEEYCKENQAGIAYYEVFAPIWAKELVEKFADEHGNIDMEALENASPELTRMVSYRIPTEEKYSIAPSKVVGFMPREAGDAVMFPYELTNIDDSDFDVDKRYFMRKDITIVLKDNKEIAKLMYDRISKEYAAAHDGRVNEKFLKDQIKTYVSNPERMLKANKGKTGEQVRKWISYLASHYRKVAYTTKPPLKGKKYRDNKIIDMTLAVLNNEKSVDKMLNPGGFEDVAKVGYQIAAYRGKAAMDKGLKWDNLSAMSEDELKALSYTSKDLGWVDTQIQFYKQNAATSSMVGIFAVSKVAHATLESDGIFIDIDEIAGTPFTIAGMEFGGRMEVDVRYDTDGNLVGKNAGSLLSASADGVKKPVLDLMNINTSTAGVINTMLRLGMPFRKAALFMSQDIIGRLLNEYNRRNLSNYVTMQELIGEFLSAYEEKYSITEDSTINTEELSEGQLIEGLRPTEHNATDYKVLQAFQKLLDISDAMMKLTFTTRFNSISSAVGPLIIDNLILEHKMEQFAGTDKVSTHFYDSPNESANPVDISTVFNRHPILSAFATAVDIAKDMFKDMPAGSQQFRSILTDIPASLQDKIYGDRKLLSQLSDFFQSYTLVASGLIDPSQLKYYIEKFPQEFIKEHYEEKYPDNALIKAIRLGSNKKSSRPFLEIKTTGMDTQQKEVLSSAWVDLHQENPELSQKLFIYNFFKAGIGFSPKTFMSLVPMYVKEHLSINGTTYVDTYRNLPNVVNKFVIDQFIRNNWNNNKLVPWKGNRDSKFNKKGTLEVTTPADIASVGGAAYIKTGSKNRTTYLWKLVSSTEGKYYKYKRLKPLGNNGEYLEIDNSELTEALSNTTETAEDNTPSSLRDQSPTGDTAAETTEPKESPKYTAQKMSDIVVLVWKQMKKFNPEVTIEQAAERVDRMKNDEGQLKQDAGFLVNVFKQKGLTLDRNQAMDKFKEMC